MHVIQEQLETIGKKLTCIGPLADKETRVGSSSCQRSTPSLLTICDRNKNKYYNRNTSIGSLNRVERNAVQTSATSAAV